MARKKKRGRPKGSKNKRKSWKSHGMGKISGYTHKKKRGRKKKAAKRSGGGHIPLPILERRVNKLANVVLKRGGKVFGKRAF